MLQVALFILIFSFMNPLWGQTDPRKDWKHLETPHFDIYFTSEDEGTGWRYGIYAEESYALLSPYFCQLPTKTVIVIDDSFDLANGAATRVPYPKIIVYPVLPDSLSTISEYGDWGPELITHEMTHIASFEAISGWARPLRSIFGSIVTPTMLLPRWWLEGIAVEMETRLSEKGRIRSGYQEATLRALVLENRLHDYRLAEINETSIPSWPAGGRPYLFGSLLWSELINEQGPGSINHLHQEYGGRLPYIINGPVEDLTGKDYSGLFAQTLNSVYLKASKQIKDLGEVTKPQIPPFAQELYKKNKNYQLQKPAISPDGLKMVVIGQKKFGEFRLIHLERGTPGEPFQLIGTKTHAESGSKEAPQDAPSGLSITRVSWKPDSSGYIFDKTGSVDPYQSLSDLYHYDWKNNKTKRLTRAQRAREASYSPKGDQIAYIELEADTTALAVFDPKTKKAKRVYEPAPGVKLSHPLYTSETQIVFSQKNPQMEEVLLSYDLETNSLSRVGIQAKEARFPAHTSEGELLFSANMNGVFNIYQSQKEGAPKALTNSATGIFAAEEDSANGDLYVTYMSARGLQVGLVKNEDFFEGELSSVESMITYPKAPSTDQILVDTSSWKLKDYEVDSYLLPHYWLPFLYQDERGQWGFSVATSGEDPLGRHAYSLSAALDPQTQQLDHAVAYSNRSFETGLHLLWSKDNELPLDSLFEQYTEQAHLLFDQQWSLLKRDINLTGGWEFLDQSIAGRNFVRTGPTLALSASTLSQEPGDVAPTTGWSAQISHTSYLEDLSDLNYNRSSLFTSYYHSYYLPEQHSLGLQLYGSYVDREINPFFGTINQGIDVTRSRLHPYLLTRGYFTYQFVGTRFANAHLEYHFPVTEIYRGSGTLPLFLRQIHSTILFDALAMEGLAFSMEESQYKRLSADQWITSVGVEANIDGTLAYSFPASLVLGMYYGLTDPHADGLRFFFGLQL